MKTKHPLIILSFLIVGLAALFLFSPNLQAANSAIHNCSGSDTAICKTNPDLIGGILKNVINFILYLAGTIAVIVIVIGGLRYITSDGDPQKASQARNSIIYALIGLAVAVLSFSIVNFVVGQL